MSILPSNLDRRNGEEISLFLRYIVLLIVALRGIEARENYRGRDDEVAAVGSSAQAARMKATRLLRRKEKHLSMHRLFPYVSCP